MSTGYTPTTADVAAAWRVASQYKGSYALAASHPNGEISAWLRVRAEAIEAGGSDG